MRSTKNEREAERMDPVGQAATRGQPGLMIVIETCQQIDDSSSTRLVWGMMLVRGPKCVNWPERKGVALTRGRKVGIATVEMPDPRAMWG